MTWAALGLGLATLGALVTLSLLQREGWRRAAEATEREAAAAKREGDTARQLGEALGRLAIAEAQSQQLSRVASEARRQARSCVSALEETQDALTDLDLRAAGGDERVATALLFAREAETAARRAAELDVPGPAAGAPAAAGARPGVQRGGASSGAADPTRFVSVVAGELLGRGAGDGGGADPERATPVDPPRAADVPPRGKR